MKNNELTLFMKSVVERLIDEHREGTAHVCKSTLNRILKFTRGRKVPFKAITPAWLAAFERELREDNLRDNTISTYMRSLRSVFNQAVEKKLAQPVPYLFKHVHTGVAGGPSRALPEETWQLIARKPEKPLPAALEETRALFILLFLLRGLPFADLVQLRRCDLVGNTIRIRRRKTGTPLVITVEPEAMEIIKRYANPDPNSLYLFPFIVQIGRDEYGQYQRALRCFNCQLEMLAILLGINVKLSSYTPRHSWATIANYHQFDKKLISNSMGHSSLEVTEKYFRAFEEAEIRKMNQQIISYIIPSERRKGDRLQENDNKLIIRKNKQFKSSITL